MKEHVISEMQVELDSLCASVRALSNKKEWLECARLACEAMGKFPEAAEPHNLFGIILEKQGDHPGAMRHFRAAWALDPTYLPARQNLETFGTFFATGRCAFDKSDCPEQKHDNYSIEYDEYGIGRLVRRAM